MRGVRSASRIKDIVESVGIETKHMYLVVGKMQDNLEKILEPEIQKTGIELLGYIPYDPLLVEYDVLGKPLYQLPEEAVSVKAAGELCLRLLKNPK